MYQVGFTTEAQRTRRDRVAAAPQALIADNKGDVAAAPPRSMSSILRVLCISVVNLAFLAN